MATLWLAEPGDDTMELPNSKLGTVPIFAQRKWDCPLPGAACGPAAEFSMAILGRNHSRATYCPEH